MSLVLSRTRNVAIGKNNPNSTLDVSGSINITGSLAISGSVNGNTAIKDGFLNVHNSGGGGYNFTVSSEYSYDPFIQMSYGSGLNPLNPGRANFLEVGAENLSLICTTGAQRINLKTLSITRLQVTPNGNVLIGTTTESIYRLDVSGSVRITNDLSLSGSIFTNNVNFGSNILSTTNVTGSFAVQVVPTDTVTISNSDVILDVNGRSGNPKLIRITNPQANSGAHAGFSAVNNGSFEGQVIMSAQQVGSRFFLAGYGAGGANILATAGDIAFYMGGTVSSPTNEAARFNRSGSLLIGLTTGSGAKLEVNGNAIITGSVSITTALTLTPSNPLPTGTTGSLATSGSALYFHDGTNWRQVQLV